MKSEQDPYAVLGVTRAATEEDVEEAYRRLTAARNRRRTLSRRTKCSHIPGSACATTASEFALDGGGKQRRYPAYRRS